MESREFVIDREFNELMDNLSSFEHEQLEKSLLKDGFKGAPIMVWKGIVVDGHNRYSICREHGIPFEVKELEFDSREDVIDWMVRTQLGRRNLSPIQRIAVAERYRPVYEKQARENQGKRTDLVVNLPQGDETYQKLGRTSEKLASIAGVSEKTYRMGAKVLCSDNEELKSEVLSGGKSISAAFKAINRKKTVTYGESNSVRENSQKADHLMQIQSRYFEFLKQFQADVKWLVSKEFEDSDGFDLTDSICSRLVSCLNALEGVEGDLSNMELLDSDNIFLNRN